MRQKTLCVGGPWRDPATLDVVDNQEAEAIGIETENRRKTGPKQVRSDACILILALPTFRVAPVVDVFFKPTFVNKKRNQMKHTLSLVALSVLMVLGLSACATIRENTQSSAPIDESLRIKRAEEKLQRLDSKFSNL